MGVKGLWAVSATALGGLILINLLLANANNTAWLVLSLVALAAALFFCFRQGASVGHASCGVSATIESARQSGEKVYAQLDKKYLAQAWSRSTGVRGIFAGALIPYVTGCIYIILSLLWRNNPGLQTAATIARIPAWLLSLPYWPIIMGGHEDFVALTPDIVVMLLVSPFVIPIGTFVGYLQGPRLWAHTEDAMKQGRRRAKARARVGKKMAPRSQKPEI